MNNLTDYIKNDYELENALQHITEHVINKSFYYRNAYFITQEPKRDMDYKNQNQRRSYYLGSEFDNCNFTGTGFTDSIFKDTDFNNCVFDNSNFESCYMFNCNFKNITPYKYASFSKSFLYESSFSNILFDRCRLSDMQFYNSTIERCDFDNTSFDGAAFNNTIFDNVTFKNLNLEYTQFINVKINDTALPFPTIPFIINGINYLMHTTDNVFVKSAKADKITKDEYLNILPHLKIYYEKTHNYFPLANIYIAENDSYNSFQNIKFGIVQAIRINNFRQLKNYCILVSSCNLFTIYQKKQLIETISKEFNSRLIDNYPFYHSLTEHFVELKNILMGSKNASLIISFKTNIENDNYSMLSAFYKAIDSLINSVGISSNYSISFSYNSEAEIIATINSLDTSIIVALITAFTTIFISGIKGLSSLPEIIVKFATIKDKIKANRLEAQNKELENVKLNLEIAKLKEEISHASTDEQCFDRLINNIETVLYYCDSLKNAGVNIENINYNSVNVNIDDLTDYTMNLIYNQNNADF